MEWRSEGMLDATLGSAEVAGRVWHRVAKMAGFTERTKVHGLGDGARWILEKFNDYFSDQGSLLVDFWHVREYLLLGLCRRPPARSCPLGRAKWKAAIVT